MQTLRYRSRAALFLILPAITLLSLSLSARAQSGNAKALVGGTLIDGFGSKPIHNSVIIIEGERIKAVGQVGTLAIPKGSEVISTEGRTIWHLDIE